MPALQAITDLVMHPRLPVRQLAGLCVVVVLHFAAFGCSSSPDEHDDTDQLIGAPPDENDPLFDHALPAEAVAADATGQVGAIDDPDAPEVTDEDDADTKIPDDDRVDPPPEIPDDRHACFSCVRICPIDDDGVARCTKDSDDLICGWGSHDTIEQARRTARAHCESSLDMARHMPNYADIDGECPPANCQ